MDKNGVIIQLEKVCFAYHGRNNVIDELDLTFRRGDRLGIIAPNGSGKTTLFHIIMGLLKPISGKIEIFGKPVQKEKDFNSVRRRIGLLFQDADDQLFSPTVLEDVAFGPLNMGKSKEEAISISRRVLDFLDLSGFEERVTFKLSGGEKKFVSLAAVLAMEPEVLLLDEPTAGLDGHARAKLIEVLSGLDLSYIVISHEYDFITSVAGHIYTIENGKIFLDEELHVHQHEHVHRLGKQPHRHI
ncbi:MAG: ABC transporter ATP-binding protein [Desulfobacterales bacterium]